LLATGQNARVFANRICQQPELMTWTPIQDLAADCKDLGSDSLAKLADIWVEQQEWLKKSEAVERFNTALRRSWAIETGILEGLYTLDRGVAELLIERGIEATLIPHDATNPSPVEVVAILKDQEQALDWVFDFVRNERPLSTSWIKELHALLTRNQKYVEAIDQFGNLQRVELLRGEYKTLPNNPRRSDGMMHTYCPPEHVASEMDRLLEMHFQHVQNRVPPEIESAWLHHRLTEIHPFQDGNGRIARAVASLVFLRSRWFPLVIDRSQRDVYLDALETADSGNLKDLVNLFADVQKKAFLKALSIADTIQRERRSVQHVVEAAVDQLRDRGIAVQRERSKVFHVAERLEKLAVGELEAIGEDLKNQLKTIDRTYRVFIHRATKGKNALLFVTPTRTLAPKLGYFADTYTYISWVELRIRGDRYTDIIFSFHSVGRNFTGLLGVTTFIEFKDVPDDPEEPARVDGPHPVLDEVFQFAYSESPDSVEERFRAWFNKALIVALDYWRKQL
jgi:Fic family protein